MKILFTSIKGGVGKTALAQCIAAHRNATYLSNDFMEDGNNSAIHIPHNISHIPKRFNDLEELVLDFGALSSGLDKKLVYALKLCNVVVIPTLTDARSLRATVETYKLVKPSGKPILIIINNFTEIKAYQYAVGYLNSELNEPKTSTIRSSKLFGRIAKDGLQWYQNIHNEKGCYQLRKSAGKHIIVYNYIAMLGALSRKYRLLLNLNILLVVDRNHNRKKFV